MSRALSIALAFAAFVFIAPPAHAAVSVTITVSRTTLSEGKSVVISGKTPGAKPGSVVELQRKTEAGWETVKTRTVWSTREYRFKTAPPRGYQKYRVLKPRQLGQASAVSPRVDLTVQWTPTITVEASMIEESTVVVSGTATGLPDGISLRREYFDGARWYWESSTVPLTAEGEFSDRFPVVMGRRFRYTAVGDGPRLGASSNEFSFTGLSNISVAMNSTTGVRFPAGKSERDMRFHVDAGQTFTVHAPWSVLPLTDPSGQQTALRSEDQMFTTVAPLTGEYAITLRSDASEALWVEVTVSTPLVIDTALDAPSQELSTNLPGQIVELVFAAEGGSLVSADHVSSDADPSDGETTLLDPGGAVVPVTPGSYQTLRVWRLPEATGNYTMRITPRWWNPLIERTDQSLLTGREATMSVDGAPAHMSFDRPGRVGEVSVTVPAGLDVFIADTVGPHDIGRLVVGPDGQRSDEHIEGTAAGTYTMYVSYAWRATEVDFFATTPMTYDLALGSPVDFDLGPAPARIAKIRIPVTAGEWYSFEALDNHGAFCRRNFWLEAGGNLLAWSLEHEDQPPVFKVAESGDLVIAMVPCTGVGAFRLTQPTFANSVETGTTTDESGNTTTTSTATLAADTPGQTMILEYDAGECCRTNWVDVSGTASSFPPDTEFSLSACRTGLEFCDGQANDTSAEILATRVYGMRGASYFFIYPGPSATGTVDLTLSRFSYN